MSVDTLVRGKRVALVIPSQGFEFDQYNQIKNILLKKGIEVTTVSDKQGGAVSQDEQSVVVDQTLDQFDCEAIDGLFLLGGKGALHVPGGYDDQGVELGKVNCLDTDICHSCIAHVKKAKIPYGAIGTSVRILAKCFALEGLNATGWDGDEALYGILEGYGATYKQDHDIVTDGLVVTARDDAADAFAEGIRRLLNRDALKK